IKEDTPPEPPNTDPVETTIHSDYMDVTIDEVFPRIIDYQVDEKVMHGEEEPVYGLYVNNKLYYPEVDFEKVDENEANYTLTVEDKDEDLDATFTLSVKVDDNNVIYRFDDITNDGDATIETLE